MYLVLDVENTVTHRDGKKHLDPFEPGNSLTMVGIKVVDGTMTDTEVYTFDHSQADPTENGRNWVQKWLDDTDMLIGHNISHDLLWLWESGFTYDGPVFDTMLAEYVLQRGQNVSLDLGSVAERYECEYKKQDTLHNYFKQGYSTRDIPHDELSDYLRHDLLATEGIFQKIQSRLSSVSDEGLRPTIELTNEVSVTLARMYRNGFKVDRAKLEHVRAEFEHEKAEIEKHLNDYIRVLMGDTPINLNSPEQLSWVVFSRKPLDKNRWAAAITPYMTDQDFKLAVKQNFVTLYKTKAVQCPSCKGKGSFFKEKKDGGLFKKSTKCTPCSGTGFEYQPTREVAGLKFTPPNAKWASANGFGTSKGNLEILERVATGKGMQEASEFLGKLRRLSALDSYLTNFVEGISAFVKPDGMLHVRLNQHITATGRFSGSNPNLQNMPRGSTFPVKKVFVSKFDGGFISEWDFAQLEFRVAGILSNDEQIKKEVKEGFDVHSYTAKIITEAGQTTSRQVAKAHTFAPLYGASGYGRTPAEAAYYTHFMEKYKGVAKWHSQLAKEVLNHGYIRTPSGREFSFPGTKRKRDGSITNFTQIKNYPVQSFATADIVPMVLIEVHNSLQREGLLSCVVNSVHDSVVLDVHPDEKDKVKSVMEDINSKVNLLVEKRFGVKTDVPIIMEGGIGKTWLDQEDWV